VETRKFISPEKRAAIIAAYDNACQICGRVFVQRDTPEIDHLLPKSKGGTEEHDNLCLLCRLCNGRRHDRSGMEAFEQWAPKLREAEIGVLALAYERRHSLIDDEAWSSVLLHLLSIIFPAFTTDSKKYDPLWDVWDLRAISKFIDQLIQDREQSEARSAKPTT
jgi:hypothetical protein